MMTYGCCGRPDLNIHLRGTAISIPLGSLAAGCDATVSGADAAGAGVAAGAEEGAYSFCRSAMKLWRHVTGREYVRRSAEYFCQRNDYALAIGRVVVGPEIDDVDRKSLALVHGEAQKREGRASISNIRLSLRQSILSFQGANTAK